MKPGRKQLRDYWWLPLNDPEHFHDRKGKRFVIYSREELP